MVSNLGVLPFETSFGGFKLESLWGQSVFVGVEGEQMIGAATLNGAIKSSAHQLYPNTKAPSDDGSNFRGHGPLTLTSLVPIVER